VLVRSVPGIRNGLRSRCVSRRKVIAVPAEWFWLSEAVPVSAGAWPAAAAWLA
jgi:hypothetical protein